MILKLIRIIFIHIKHIVNHSFETPLYKILNLIHLRFLQLIFLAIQYHKDDNKFYSHSLFLFLHLKYIVFICHFHIFVLTFDNRILVNQNLKF
jgi:hypothetical protein